MIGIALNFLGKAVVSGTVFDACKDAFKFVTENPKSTTTFIKDALEVVKRINPGTQDFCNPLIYLADRFIGHLEQKGLEVPESVECLKQKPEAGKEKAYIQNWKRATSDIEKNILKAKNPKADARAQANALVTNDGQHLKKYPVKPETIPTIRHQPDPRQNQTSSGALFEQRSQSMPTRCLGVRNPFSVQGIMLQMVQQLFWQLDRIECMLIELERRGGDSFEMQPDYSLIQSEGRSGMFFY